MPQRRRFALALLACASAIALPAAAQAPAFPGKTVTIVVPFSAGGGVDTMARLLAEELRASLKQNVIVDNKPGASGMIGARAVAKATPDGHTLLMGSAGETAINAFVYKAQMQYSPAKDLAPIALVSKVPNVLVASKSFPPNNVEQLVEYAKKNPDKVVYSSSGVGNPQHLNGALLEQLAGIQLVHAPYKGASGQLVDVVSGTVPLTFVSYAAAKAFIADGKVKPIAVTSVKRTVFAPDIPAIAEYAPLARYQLENWFGLFAPAGTPKEVIRKLAAEGAKVLAAPDLQERLAGQGAEAAPSTPEQLAELLKQDLVRWAGIVKASGATID